MLLLLIVNGVVGKIYAWDDCPKGLVNDPYPGSCSRYIDTDGNGICDHSEPAPEDREKSQPIDLPENQEKGTALVASNTQANKSPNKAVIATLSIVLPLTAIVTYAYIHKLKS